MARCLARLTRCYVFHTCYIYLIALVATPLYIVFVCGMGILRFISPWAYHHRNMEEYKQLHGVLKTAEISLESAIQTWLGE